MLASALDRITDPKLRDICERGLRDSAEKAREKALPAGSTSLEDMFGKGGAARMRASAASRERADGLKD